ncbi:MAG: hypothetical protein VX072_04095, partial [Pseudomonadota bacterium]|nr:hypothetical protein [Pseudomonadota bacterium]
FSLQFLQQLPIDLIKIGHRPPFRNNPSSLSPSEPILKGSPLLIIRATNIIVHDSECPALQRGD